MTVILIAILVLSALGLIFGVLLGFASIKFKVEEDPIAEKIDAILPQTQCGQCGYPGCKPYAEAVANGDAINKCAPGGQQTIEIIADMMNVDIPPAQGEEVEEPVKKVAFIIEDDCIGCTKCIQACPVDAILGTTKQMHTIITDECTGCDLCVEPCPVDCIEMIPVKQTTKNWNAQLTLIPIKQLES
ncbi:electron transport complex subunit RsxB [Psychrobium sp. 1_MG-2023]|uniref:electron transport complex subunit RsxB n=1 Tax=Psychrobium sp. 1_MG-2023 TaxID=3062624 RepID=UPI000C32B239|nr:electron transport complex subunit RsxB [Psychrobium sp. 1_MG-2023]MDP2562953.1 electron transport complex subunit RsxB [Psychrobium sp. 1_MG-2023]PKF54037.1 electron transport complex subunit RsxB [Alteromonadales bacterium alter-6D02]